MIFYVEHHKTRSGPIRDAIDLAGEIVNGWGGRGGNEDIYRDLAGWPLVDLIEHIAAELLHAQGFDTDELEEMVSCTTSEQYIMDQIAIWERRGPTLRKAG